MKKMIVLLTMLLCIASSCFAAEERSTKDIFADTTIANVVITGDGCGPIPIWMVILSKSLTRVPFASL